MATDLLEKGLARLSAEQREVVFHDTGPLLVAAGAGSGKTSTVVLRVARLIRDGVDPRSFLISTFTNRAANEFRERLWKLLGPGAEQLRMGTLHAWGCKILRQHGRILGVPGNFQIADTNDQLKLMKGLLQEEFPDITTSPSDLIFRIGFEKEALRTPGELSARKPYPGMAPFPSRSFPEIFAAYEERLLEADALDFADLISLLVELLERDPTLPRKLGIEWLLVDEVQDLAPSQTLAVRKLLTTDNLMAVGDSDQRIFSWRGSDAALILDFAQLYPHGKIISLGCNYRSSRTIVDAAAGVIANNTERVEHRLYAHQQQPSPVVLRALEDSYKETDAVVAQLQAWRRLRVPWKEMAILYRTNRQSLDFERALLTAKIPHRVIGTAFFQRREIRDVLYYLRLLANPEERLALDEVYCRPNRRCGAASWTKVKQFAKAQQLSLWTVISNPEHLSASGIPAAAQQGIQEFVLPLRNLRRALSAWTLPALLDTLLQDTGLLAWYAAQETKEDRAAGRSRTENLAQLRTLLSTQFNGPAEDELVRFLDHSALCGGETDEQALKDTVSLLTIHSAKGLEFQAVALVGCEEEILPHQQALRDADPEAALEEERRLFYVAMTRAKEHLLLTWAARRIQPGGGAKSQYRSRFLDELPASIRQTAAHRLAA